MEDFNLTQNGALSREDSTYNVTSFDRNFLHWSFIVMEVVAIVVIVIGDISVLMLFFTRKLLGQSTNILVFSLAIGDLLTGLLTFPLAMLQKIMYEPSEFLCKGYFYFANVSKTAVSYTILLLAMERIAAMLSHTFRILPPGRCLFFASLTWFFSAAYNIWSVVIYDLETVEVIPRDRHKAQSAFSICFASTRFMYLHAIFEFLNPLVTFAFPVTFSSLLFIGFWCKRDKADKPGRPYKSSRSVVIFTLALLVSFTASQLPWEVANIVFIHDASRHGADQLMVLKILHIISFSRGFWDIFIFGMFRRYVCKKEKALQHFREQRSLQVQRSSLAIPMADRPASLSILDSDPSVSRRYSSDCTISRRPSGMEESCIVNTAMSLNGLGTGVCGGGGGGGTAPGTTSAAAAAAAAAADGHSNSSNDPQAALLDPSHERSTPHVTTTTIILAENCLIPRSPCLHDQSRRFSFAPPPPLYGDQLHVPKSKGGGGGGGGGRHRHSSASNLSSSNNSSSIRGDNPKDTTATSAKGVVGGNSKCKGNILTECSTHVSDSDNADVPSDAEKPASENDNTSSSSFSPLSVKRSSIERRKSAPGCHSSRENTKSSLFVLLK